MTNIELLKRRYLQATEGCNQDIHYRILPVDITNPGCYPKENLRKTPDDCLKDVYQDAHARHLKQIKLQLFAFDIDAKQEDILGYFWETGKGTLTVHDPRDSSFMRIVFDGYGGGEMIKLQYPDQKPETEIFSFLWGHALEWCKWAGYTSIQEHSDQVRKNFMTTTVGTPYDPGEEEILVLKKEYVKEGYDVENLIPMDKYIVL